METNLEYYRKAIGDPNAQLYSGPAPQPGPYNPPQERASNVVGGAAVNPDGSQNPYAGSLAGRYTTSTPAVSPLQKAREALASQLTTGPVDEAAIREQTRKNLQAQVDATNAYYNDLASRERAAGDVRNAQTRGINVRAGLIGSDFASTNAAETEKKNQEVLKAVEHERLMKLSGIFDQIDQRAEAAIKAKKEEALGNATAWVDYLSKAASEAKENVQNLAKSGVSLEKLKTDPSYQQLLEETGLRPLELDSLFNANLPANQKVKYTFDVRKDGSIVRFGDNGSYDVFADTKIPPEVDPQFITADNGDILYIDKNNPTNADGSMKYQKLGNFANPKNALEQEELRAQIENIKANTAKTQAEMAGSGDTSKTKEQVSLLQRSIGKAIELSGASGRSGARKTAESWFVGATDYTNLEAETNTIRTNILTIMSDPNIKKFFGPQMSEADVRLMTSAGTTLNPELQSPEGLMAELTRLNHLILRMQSSVPAGAGTGDTTPPPQEGDIESYRNKYNY